VVSFSAMSLIKTLFVSRYLTGYWYESCSFSSSMLARSCICMLALTRGVWLIAIRPTITLIIGSWLLCRQATPPAAVVSYMVLASEHYFRVRQACGGPLGYEPDLLAHGIVLNAPVTIYLSTPTTPPYDTITENRKI
jgi:hypothetical protein